MEVFLKVENITKQFAGHTALDDVSLEVPRGCVYGLLGPNGAGKTTLIRIINHITAPDKGRVWFNGHPLSPADVANIGYLPEERGLYKTMKVGEQALYFAQLKGLSKAEATARLKRWFIKFGIEGWWNKKVSELSKGMAQKVQFIVTVLHEPQLLIFDEPFSGFDPINANLLKNEILELRDKGATVIFSTHNMASVEEVCDHITLINKSKNILSGSLDEVRRSHGGNIFEVDFRGNKESLVGALAGLPCGLLDESLIADEDKENRSERALKIHIERDEDVRSVVEVINNTVQLRTFREVIPSMNDIFIQAVAKHSAK
ncbi:MAG: ATP-binding cassette domain-containing protein [Tidjanibacter sp.]|nr:ATP-binding cassette domain-containing protein [Tidjanibacter sp.]MBR7128714.1 ATP-binding cassette domain-containing protein [Tidjanibacter sp.]